MDYFLTIDISAEGVDDEELVVALHAYLSRRLKPRYIRTQLTERTRPSMSRTTIRTK